MSKKIYDYNTCYEIAKNYTCSSEFQKGNGSAYNVARKNGWIKDYTWFIKKQHDVYTYEECYEIAKDYDCVSEFQKGNGSVYAKARERGWLKDYTWFKPRSRKPYTYEECYEIAKKYDTRTKYCKGNIGAYQASLNHGWLDDYTWFHYVQRPTGYWTKEKVIEESKKYKTRGEFHDYNGTAYSKARTNGWLDEMVWLKDDRIDFSTDKVDCVYAYEFVDFNSVYIGRTLFRRVNERDKEHLFNDRDTVSKFCREKDIHIPAIKILENDLTLAEGVEKEGYYVEKYKQEGWNILNKAKTGSIGLIAKNKWTKKTCYEEARKYKTKMEFYKGSGGCYDAARRSGWLKDYTWFEEKQKPKGYWDNYENCYNAAKECKTVSEFVHMYNRAYIIAKKNDWLKDYTWFNIKRIAHNKKWDYETVLAEAQKYNTRKEFSTKARGAYKVALANGWMQQYDWFEDTHETLSKALNNSWESRRKWTYDVCKQLAEESSGRLDFRRKYASAYHASYRHNWLDDFFPKKQD